MLAQKITKTENYIFIKLRIVKSILVYGAEVWQIPTREINKMLSTEMDVLRRSARKSRMERRKNEHIKEIMGVKGKAGYHIYHTEKKNTMVWPRQKDARGENTKINYGMDNTGKNEKCTSKKNVDRSTSSHNNKKFGTRSMEKQRGMTSGFRKTAIAVIKPDGWMDGWMDRYIDTFSYY